MICVLVKTIEKVSYRRIPIILLHLYKVTALDQWESQTSEKVRRSWVVLAYLAQPCRNTPGSVPQSYRTLKEPKSCAWGPILLANT